MAKTFVLLEAGRHGKVFRDALLQQVDVAGVIDADAAAVADGTGHRGGDFSAAQLDGALLPARKIDQRSLVVVDAHVAIICSVGGVAAPVEVNVQPAATLPAPGPAIQVAEDVLAGRGQRFGLPVAPVACEGAFVAAGAPGVNVAAGSDGDVDRIEGQRLSLARFAAIAPDQGTTAGHVDHLRLAIDRHVGDEADGVGVAVQEVVARDDQLLAAILDADQLANGDPRGPLPGQRDVAGEPQDGDLA